MLPSKSALDLVSMLTLVPDSDRRRSASKVKTCQ